MTAIPKRIVAGQPLSPTERAILSAVARGMTDAEIGRELHMSESTVKYHHAVMRRKLGNVRNRAQLVTVGFLSGNLRMTGDLLNRKPFARAA